MGTELQAGEVGGCLAGWAGVDATGDEVCDGVGGRVEGAEGSAGSGGSEGRHGGCVEVVE